MELPFEKETAAYFKEFEKYNRNLFQITRTLLNTEDVELARAPKDLVFQEDKLRLFRFRPTREDLCPVPVLISYALVNRETMMDLEEGRSLVNNLLALGLDIYIIVWGSPTRMDRFITLDDYIDIYLDDCVEFIR